MLFPNPGPQNAAFVLTVRLVVCVADEADAAVVEALTLDELLAAYDACVLPGAPARRKLSVQLVSQQLAEAPPPPPGSSDGGARLLAEDLARPADDDGQRAFARAESAFKAGLACAPAAAVVPSAAFGEFAVPRSGL